MPINIQNGFDLVYPINRLMFFQLLKLSKRNYCKYIKNPNSYKKELGFLHPNTFFKIFMLPGLNFKILTNRLFHLICYANI